MSADSLTLRTCIKKELKERVLLRGSCVAGTGALLLLFSGIFLQESFMAAWGWLVGLVGISLIAFGMIPYRRLQRLEDSPHKLVVTEKGLAYVIKGKIVWTLAQEAIKSIDYWEKPNTYGISLHTQDERTLQLPYFTKDACAALKDNLSI